MLVCEDPATKPDCTARAFSTVHLNWPVFVAPEEKVFPVPKFGLRGQAFSCWNAGRKKARTGSEHVSRTRERLELSAPWGEKQHDLFWTPWPELEKPCGLVGHNKSPTNGRGSICRGIRLCKFRFARCQPGEHPPISICFGLVFFSVHTQGTKMLFLFFLFFVFCFFSIGGEVPRHSQTRRDQVGTSNWVEALQILTHLLI